MMDDRIWKLLARKLSGEASPDDLKELEKLVKENSDLHQSIDALTNIWSLHPKESPDSAIQKLLRNMS
jgi:transmembrane sensor